MSDGWFEWDPNKARSNERKHGVSFGEAMTVFWDEEGLFLDDPEHSGEENRFVLLGVSASLRLLVVVHTVRHDDSIRIISARKARPSEIRNYQNRLR